MKFDFAVPMTFYELLAIVLAAVAIIIPIVQAIWKRWIIAPKLNFLPTGRVTLFFNQSGSYLRVDGVYEAQNKPIAVKNISIKVTRKKDDQKLNLSWSSFISPVNQSMVGNYLQTTESAHPFRIEADSIMSAFTEFGDSFDSFGKTFRANTAALFKQIPGIRMVNNTYEEALQQYKASPDYTTARTRLEKEFFWEIGKYSLEITAEFGEKRKVFQYEISVGEYEHNRLAENVDEALLSPLKSAYGVTWDYHAAYVELHATEK
ncbi:MAG: hypothetical protein IKJ65_00855 [Clostridia bacterium]|nr:hypothetical protein [Clostridia bacterium]